MDALELALNCSSLLLRTNTIPATAGEDNEPSDSSDTANKNDRNSNYEMTNREELNESDREDHFKGKSRLHLPVTHVTYPLNYKLVHSY